MAQVIQLRRGSSAEWSAANPLLAEGEIGVELDTLKWKVGNGDQTWMSLPYASPSGEWVQLTQAAYDALPIKNGSTLYVIVG